MISIPVSKEAAWRTARTTLVIAAAVAALAMSLPNVYFVVARSYGPYGFFTDANVVVAVEPRAAAAGFRPGDRIDYPRMPAAGWYGDPSDGMRAGPIGEPISFFVLRDGRRETIALAAEDPHLNDTANLITLVVQKSSFLVLVLMGSALALLRPSRLTLSFFAFCIGHARVLPLIFYFLPANDYAVVMAVNDAIASLGPIGFFGVAYFLARDERHRLTLATAAVLFTLVAVPLVASDVLELTAGVRPAWPAAGWISFLTVAACYVAGFGILLRLVASSLQGRAVKLAALLMATIGALALISITQNAEHDPWYFANLPTVAMTRWLGPGPTHWHWPLYARLFVALTILVAAVRGKVIPLKSRPLQAAVYALVTIVAFEVLVPNGDLQFTYRLIASLVVAYIIIARRIIDVGPVLRGTVAYMFVAFVTIALAMAAGVAFGSQLATHVLLLPIGIAAAIALGYWTSGLRDIGRCLSLVSAEAPNAWGRGHTIAEHDALTQALGLAERMKRAGLTAEVRAHCAFVAWRNGETTEFERHIAALRGLADGHSMKGLSTFLAAADGMSRHQAGDLPEWTARAALLRNAAVEAKTAADNSGDTALRALAAVALAESDPSRREAMLEEANAIARDAGWPALSKSVVALRANARDIGLLQPFVDVRLRKSRPSSPVFEIGFFKAELRYNGSVVALQDKELELLLTVAATKSGLNDALLLDALWPEADGDAARNAFRVCLHRLRKSAGDPRIVTRSGKAYAVHPWADVDLWNFEAAIARYRDRESRGAAEELEIHCEAARGGAARRASLGIWFERFELLLAAKLDEAERLLSRGVARM